MATKRFSIHPGVARNKANSGALAKKVDGTYFTFLEQRLPPTVVRRADFQSILVPSDIDVTGNITFNVVFRQVDAGVGIAVAHVLAIAKKAGIGRDAAALISRSANIPVGDSLPLPGVVGKEVTLTQTMPASGLSVGEELLFAVERIGTHSRETFAGNIGIDLVYIDFPTLDVVDDPEELADAAQMTLLMQQMVARLQEIEIILAYHQGG